LEKLSEIIGGNVDDMIKKNERSHEVLIPKNDNYLEKNDSKYHTEVRWFIDKIKGLIITKAIRRRLIWACLSCENKKQ